MKTRVIILLLVILKPSLSQVSSNFLELKQTITLNNVIGRIGQLAYDDKQQHIYVAALSNNTLEIVDLAQKKTIRSIKALRQPNTLSYSPSAQLLYIGCLGDGLCRVFNTNDFKELKSLRFDAKIYGINIFSPNQQFYISFGEGVISVFDANTLKLQSNIKLTAPGEALYFDETKQQLFISLPKLQEVHTIDLKSNVVKNTFKLTEASENYPLAYDAETNRLFVGCRKPAKLLVLNAEKGNIVSSIDIDGDVTEIIFNKPQKQIYAICGDGYLHVIKQEIKEVKQVIKPTPSKSTAETAKQSKTSKTQGTSQKKTTTQKPKSTAKPKEEIKIVKQDTYNKISRIFTGNGARTAVWLHDANQIVVAAPAFAGKSAQLLFYQVPQE